VPAAFPTDADVTALLVATGVLSGGLPAALSGIATDASRQWERDSGFVPWIASTHTVRTFDPPISRVLDLGGGVLAFTSVTVGVTTTSAGTVLTTGVDYFPMPSGAVDAGFPYTSLAFGYALGGLPGSVKVDGTWGFVAAGSNAVPQDVFDAVCRLAALKCLPVLQQLTGNITREKQGDVEYAWAGVGSGLAAGTPDQWLAEYNLVLNRYKRAWFV
jgi:hypothetical protein